LIGIDGLGGAGKTSLAGAICDARADLHVVHGDDPRKGCERYVDHQRLAAELPQPLRRGEPRRFQ
jgi:hypothetical protein